jgi:hypothetical protein
MLGIGRLIARDYQLLYPDPVWSIKLLLGPTTTARARKIGCSAERAALCLRAVQVGGPYHI